MGNKSKIIPIKFDKDLIDVLNVITKIFIRVTEAVRGGRNEHLHN
ncbi:MAG: hypothetical protein QXG39_01780 [Candidatus Aenigmatarchaeota archaeon]